MGLDIDIYEIDEKSEKIFTEYEEVNPFPKHFNAFEEEEEFLDIQKMCADRGGVWNGHTVADPEFGDPIKGMILFVGKKRRLRRNSTTRYLISDEEIKEKYTFKGKVWRVKVNSERLGFWNMGYCGLERWKDRKTPFDEDVTIKRYHFEEESLDEIEEMILDEKKLTWLKEFRIKFKELLNEEKMVFVYVSG